MKVYVVLRSGMWWPIDWRTDPSKKAPFTKVVAVVADEDAAKKMMQLPPEPDWYIGAPDGVVATSYVQVTLESPTTKSTYDPSKPLHDLEGWIVFYGQQAQRLENDETMAEVFQASCETADLLLELQSTREALRIACADAWPYNPHWPDLYLQRARSNISVAAVQSKPSKEGQ